MRDPVEPSDLALALHAGRVVRRQVTHEVVDAVAQLQREVGGGGAHQLAHVLHGRLALVAVVAFELAHGAFDCTGISSVIASIWACWRTEMTSSSPRIQARL